jgi:NAD(P)-dependent dehydrogenase (short-subunit alcohol dehydrogenase family)
MDQPLPTVLVTGASSGIGLATAQLLACAGFRVLAGVRCDRGQAALTAFDSANITPVRLDVTQAEHVELLLPQIRQLSPSGLYALVNNAGIGPPAAVELTDLDELRRVLEVNTLAPLRMIQACLPMLREGRGRIVNISSMNGAIAMPMIGAYSASKFALEALSDTLRIELRPWNIPISLIRPGQVGTPIFEKARRELEARSQAIPEELKVGYGKLYERAAQFNERGAKAATTPARVARTVLKALRARRPKLHYVVGADALGLQALRAVVPTRWFDGIMAVAMGLKNGKR